MHYVHPDKPKPELWINEVSVAEAHRGQGIARQLMDTVLNEGRRLGCSEGWVLTHPTNTAAMQLSAACGGRQAPEKAVMFEFKLL